MMAAVCEGRATYEDLGRSWGLSWVGNAIGCGLFAVACKYAGVLEGGAGHLAALTLATKTSSELGPILVKAMFCNWLVCIAVFLSTQAKDMTGKYLSIWLPVSAFVSIGFEHSVANLFLLPAGLMSTDEITFGTAMIRNLLPVTIGNAISGSLFVGAAMSYMYGSLGKATSSVEQVDEQH
jgi:formate/nitrite transporter